MTAPLSIEQAARLRGRALSLVQSAVTEPFARLPDGSQLWFCSDQGLWWHLAATGDLCSYQQESAVLAVEQVLIASLQTPGGAS